MAEITVLNIYRGIDAGIVISMVTPPIGGVAGWNLTFTVREKQETAGTPLLQLTTTGGGVVTTNSTVGVWRVSIAAATLEAMAAPSGFVWDFWRTDSGSKDILALGDFNLLGQVRLAPAA